MLSYILCESLNGIVHITWNNRYPVDLTVQQGNYGIKKYLLLIIYL